MNIGTDAMQDNESLYFTSEDYEKLKGPDWPSYQDFLAGNLGPTPAIQKEITDFKRMFRSDGIKFPIRTATACQSKWTWSTIYLNQLSTASCHRVNPVPLDLENFENFHNLPKKLQDRRLMLQGKWPTGGCEYCRDIEAAGGHSDRLHNLEIRDLTPPELESDQTAVEVTPRIVEIFAQNTCNFSCVYCNAHLSSQIESENRKYGDFNQNGVRLPVMSVPTPAQQVFDRFMQWLAKNIGSLRRLHLLGGETFLQHDLMHGVLSILENNPSPDLELCIFSNMNAPDRIWQKYTQQIKSLQHQGHIKVFDLTASIDCWGDAAEYTRQGLSLDKFEKNFAWAADQDPAWLRLNVNQTVTAMTIKTMPELIDKITKYSNNRHIGHYFQFYTGPQMFQHPKTFAYDFWRDDFARIYAAMPRRTVEQQEAIPRMQGLEQLLKQHRQHDWQAIAQLHTLLDELDRRRQTNWRDVFPYLNISPEVNNDQSL
jgi:pyruvate-formate lyase-activating enzyme